MASKNIEKIGNVVLDLTYYAGEDLYSEGAAEDRLLDFVKNHTHSEYENYIQSSRSWSVMYHLSHIRENVASWLPIRSNQTVLEVGSGCGAITGAFARTAKHVTCVELSKKRSMINAYRNKEFDNLEIMVGNFEDIEPNLEEKYDFITLIGVFEYAESYIHSENPYNTFLQILKKHLAPGGKIVIAIENRLGLKYFAGCKEDHLGQYFAGIMGYKPGDGVKTFSKKTLSELLSQEGLYYKFYYPYPDYKLPHTIYSDDKLPSVGDLNTNLRNFDDDRMVLFDEEKAYNALIEEGLFQDYANSFIIMASPDANWTQDLIVPIYSKYANERMKKYMVSTMIAVGPEGEKYVFKRALSSQANAHISKLCDNYERLTNQFGSTGLKPVRSKYIRGVERGSEIVGVASKAKDLALFDFASGMTFEDYLNELEAAGNYEKVESLILDYCNRLHRTADEVDFKRTVGFDEMFGKRNFSKKYVATKPCNLDMIFSNIVLDKEEKEDGDWTVLDYEWVLDFPVPIQFVIYRALFYHFRDKDDCGFSVYLSRKGMDVFSLCGIDIGERMLFEEMEHAFQVYIIGGVASLDVMRVLMPTSTVEIDESVSSGFYLKNLDTPKIYFSRSNTFSEDNQITLIGNVEHSRVTFRLQFDRFISSLRIDPTEYPCMIHINDVKYSLNDGTKCDVKSLIMNGYMVSDRTYLFDTNDPQIIFEDVPPDAKSMEVDYSVTMPVKVFYEELVNNFKEQEKLEEELRKSFGYRLKRKVGIIKENNIPTGYKKIIFS